MYEWLADTETTLSGRLRSRLWVYGAMTRIFGEYRVRIDPWEVDYGDQTPLASLDQRPDEQVDLDVEVPAGDWSAVVPSDRVTLPDRVVFIDGVRRLEARVQVRHDQHLIYGGFGSCAVGAAIMHGSAAEFGEMRVFRSFVLGAARPAPSPVRVHDTLEYRAESTPRTESDGPLRHIQDSMRTAEADLATALCDAGTLVIVDGPLSFVPQRPERAVGYIKRLHDLYLPSRYLPFIAALPQGARTPLFAIRSAKSGFSRYAWFQRLAEPAPGATELHGLVRLEVGATAAIDTARQLADAAAARLPRIAPHRARDPRSPQNLLPIGALEQRLRARLGDARLIRRWIETLVAREAEHD